MARPVAFNEQIILDSVLELFWSKGYHDTSTQDIMEATGLSKSSIYNSFTDKRTLFLKVLDRYMSHARTAISNVFANSEKSTYDKLKEFLTKAGSSKAQEGACSSKGCFVVNTAVELAPHDPEIRKIINEHRLFAVGLLTSAIQDGVDKGEFRKDVDPAAQAEFLHLMVAGMKAYGKVAFEQTEFLPAIEIALQCLSKECK